MLEMWEEKGEKSNLCGIGNKQFLMLQRIELLAIGEYLLWNEEMEVRVLVKYTFEKGEGNSVKMTPILIEKAVKFFLEKQMMGDIIQRCEIKKEPISHDLRTDFVAGNTCIETRVLMRKQEGVDVRNLLHLLVSNKRNYNVLQEHYKRVILLVVCEEGVYEGQMGESSIYKEVGKIFEGELNHGVEVWISVIKYEADGISLISCQNLTNIVAGDRDTN